MLSVIRTHFTGAFTPYYQFLSYFDKSAGRLPPNIFDEFLFGVGSADSLLRYRDRPDFHRFLTFRSPSASYDLQKFIDDSLEFHGNLKNDFLLILNKDQPCPIIHPLKNQTNEFFTTQPLIFEPFPVTLPTNFRIFYGSGSDVSDCGYQLNSHRTLMGSNLIWKQTDEDKNGNIFYELRGRFVRNINCQFHLQKIKERMSVLETIFKN